MELKVALEVEFIKIEEVVMKDIKWVQLNIKWSRMWLTSFL